GWTLARLGLGKHGISLSIGRRGGSGRARRRGGRIVRRGRGGARPQGHDIGGGVRRPRALGPAAGSVLFLQVLRSVVHVLTFPRRNFAPEHAQPNSEKWKVSRAWIALRIADSGQPPEMRRPWRRFLRRWAAEKRMITLK